MAWRSRRWDFIWTGDDQVLRPHMPSLGRIEWNNSVFTDSPYTHDADVAYQIRVVSMVQSFI